MDGRLLPRLWQAAGLLRAAAVRVFWPRILTALIVNALVIALRQEQRASADVDFLLHFYTVLVLLLDLGIALRDSELNWVLQLGGQWRLPASSGGGGSGLVDLQYAFSRPAVSAVFLGHVAHFIVHIFLLVALPELFNVLLILFMRVLVDLALEGARIGAVLDRAEAAFLNACLPFRDAPGALCLRPVASPAVDATDCGGFARPLARYFEWAVPLDTTREPINIDPGHIVLDGSDGEEDDARDRRRRSLTRL
jgi:hypothetical protein